MKELFVEIVKIVSKIMRVVISVFLSLVKK